MSRQGCLSLPGTESAVHAITMPKKVVIEYILQESPISLPKAPFLMYASIPMNTLVRPYTSSKPPLITHPTPPPTPNP